MNKKVKNHRLLIEEITRSPHVSLSWKDTLKSIFKTYVHTAVAEKSSNNAILLAPNNQTFSAYSKAIYSAMDHQEAKVLQLSFASSIRKYKLDIKFFNITLLLSS